MPPLIRNFTSADYAAAMALWQATPGVGLSDADRREPIERFLARNPGLSFVACAGSELVGTVLCGHDGRRGLIHHLVAAAGHRRQGLGRELLNSALRALRREGIDKCHLLVFQSNADGLAFWRSVSATERTELVLLSIVTGNAS
jgi:ribosomal protein S18 acetylase RimI-like enzyme